VSRFRLAVGPARNASLLELLARFWAWELRRRQRRASQDAIRSIHLSSFDESELRRGHTQRVPIDDVFSRIVAHEGEVFRQVRGEPFTYVVQGLSVRLSRTNRIVGKGEFAKALERCPLTRPSQISHVQAPSYVFAILTDDRIHGCDGGSR
jgi:hypothetical protein